MSTFSRKPGSAQGESSAVRTSTFSFTNKHESLLVFPDSTNSAQDVVDSLNLEPYKAVFLNLGGTTSFDSSIQSKLTQLFSRGIASAALEANAVVVDGGLPTGAMELMGKGIADRGYKSELIGIAPISRVTMQGDTITNTYLDPNHSHFILTDSDDWKSQPIITGIIDSLIRRPGVLDDRDIERKVPAIAIVTGGNDSTKDILLQAVRQKMPIVVVEGSKGFADELAAAYKTKDTPPEDPSMAEILADGKIVFHDLSKSPTDIRALIASAMGVDKVLMQAWETFADYDLNANLQQKRFDVYQQAIIVIGIVGTFLAIVQQIIKPADDATNVSGIVTGLSSTLYVVLIIIPIALTILITITNRFKQGNKWLLLRAAAESIKREMFRYRTRTNDYAPPKPVEQANPADPASPIVIVTAEQQLALKVQDITTRVMRTEVNSSYLIPYNKELGFPPDMYGAIGGDDGFSQLDPERYINIRLTDQLSYFRRKSVRLGKQLSYFSVAIFIVGGIGTFLAAIHQPVWIALTTTLVAGLTAYLGYRQTENTLTKYNQTATNLTNIKSWWYALTNEQQAMQDNINTLVDHTEQVLQVELDGWVQQMQNALAELRKNQESGNNGGGDGPGGGGGGGGAQPQAEAQVQAPAPAADGQAENENNANAEAPAADEGKAEADQAGKEPEVKAEGETPVENNDQKDSNIVADTGAAPADETKPAEAPVEGTPETTAVENDGQAQQAPAEAAVGEDNTTAATPSTPGDETAPAVADAPDTSVPEKDPSSAESDEPVTTKEITAGTGSTIPATEVAVKTNGSTPTIHVQAPAASPGEQTVLFEPESPDQQDGKPSNGKK